MKSGSFAAPGVLLLAALGCRDDAGSPTEPTAIGPHATVSGATALAFSQVSAREGHTCGVTADNRAYCWGYDDYGQLGDGTSTGPERE